MTALTKTAVAKRTREIRREAALLSNIVDMLDSHRNDNEPLIHVLRRRATPQTREALEDALNNIDGVSAQLREMLEV